MTRNIELINHLRENPEACQLLMDKSRELTGDESLYYVYNPTTEKGFAFIRDFRRPYFPEMPTIQEAFITTLPIRDQEEMDLILNVMEARYKNEE